MNTETTAREEAVDAAYSTDTVTLEKCGRVATITEISFGDYAAMSRFFGEYFKQFINVALDENGEQIDAADIDRIAMMDAVITSIGSDPQGAFNLCECMSDMNMADIKALGFGDGSQLLKACVTKIDAADIQRFFQNEMEMIQGIQPIG